MKVLRDIKLVHIISNLSPGGAQVLLLDILKNLGKRQNIDIFLIVLDSGVYIKKFEDNGIKVIDLKEKGLINFKLPGKLKRIIKEIDPDIVHTHLLKADIYGRIAAKQVSVPVIYSTCHNYSFHHKGTDINKKSVFNVIDDFVISYSKSNLVAISEIVKKYLVNRNGKYEKDTEVIYNGVNMQKEKYILDESNIAKFRNDNGISKKDFLITILGRLEMQKGHSFFLDSIKDLLKEKQNIRVLIIGEGDLRGDIESQIRENDLTEYVTLKGFQTDTEKFIEISDLICVPSLWEGFGLVIIEGMVKKKIVLASDVGGIPEIITDGNTGFLFEVKNRESFINKINFICDNFNSLDFIKQSALNLVKDKFDIEKNSELYYQSYLKKINAIR